MERKKLNGVTVPLGALFTNDNPVIGEFPDLKLFADFCKKAGFSLIQLLPVNDTGTQSSPYSGLSAFALHPIYIRLNQIAEFKNLYESDCNFKTDYDNFLNNHKYCLRYNYDEILNGKIDLLRKIFSSTEDYKSKTPSKQLFTWIKNNEWVKTYAVYKALKWDYMQSSWKQWKKEDQKKSEAEILELWEDKSKKTEHLFYAWLQMIADNQFSDAVKYVHNQKILLKGDMPILMNEDSCDAWANPQFFNQNLRAGAPADGDNALGQNWGFPTYNWKNLKNADYSWWKGRLKVASKYYDAYRLDHILGFYRIWAIPGDDVNALNGHTEPFAFIKKTELYDLGFDDNRIRWISSPHIPTHVIEYITWNHEQAHKVLSKFCNQIGSEELWLFKPEIKGSKAFYEADFSGLCHPDAIGRIQNVLVEYWSNRTLLEISKDKYVPLWTYSRSTSWQTLNDDEKNKLLGVFENLNSKNEKLWAKQADEIFTAITKDLDMIPCGEDLGVNIECVPKVMEKHDILGLRVVRWCRDWEKPGQPYVDFKDYTPLSVTTTSVHDSSTIRQWWEDEKDSAKAFVFANPAYFGIKADLSDSVLEQKSMEIAQKDFSTEIAHAIMHASFSSASLWNISPLQDYLYMEEKYWLSDAKDERINIPGTVSSFNWTYRLPASVETILQDESLIKKIKE